MLNFANKKVLVFDLDGTIVKLPVNWKRLKDLLSNAYKKTYNEKCEFIHITACLDKVVEKRDENNLQDFFNIIEDFELSSLEKNNEDLRIIETVYFIKNLNTFGVHKDVKLAVLSLNTRKAIKKALKIAGLQKEFDFIVGREDVRKWKPDPEGLERIKDYYNVNEKEMVYFGDLDKDVITGKNANIDAYLIDEIINLVNEKRKNIENKS